ncbi:hypothetical protein [Oceanicola sp. 502str15]|uniref:hypothetical protein n=1 Tax=Oceanicola sp. 502str15 TaxID=2696061 RepID=UPI002094EF58|nr:hypothetical protein [Oceanicola sp. 502str15]MCO6382416.1 hypothetical protein [Oceanicola sp. 502str15]
MGFSLRSVLVIASLATPAAAECPVPSDLADGIATRDDTGGVTVFRAGTVPGEVTETTRFEDDTGFFVRSTGGLLVLESYDLESGEKAEGTTVESRFDSPGEIFPVAEGRTAEVSGTEVSASGEETAVTVLIESGLMHRVVYGACEVQAIPVRMTYDYAGDRAEVEHLDYLPEFGISLFLGAGDLGGAPDIYRILDLYKATE